MGQQISMFMHASDEELEQAKHKKRAESGVEQPALRREVAARGQRVCGERASRDERCEPRAQQQRDREYRREAAETESLKVGGGGGGGGGVIGSWGSPVWGACDELVSMNEYCNIMFFVGDSSPSFGEWFTGERFIGGS